MSGRTAAGLVAAALALTVTGGVTTAGAAQEVAPPRLTVTALANPVPTTLFGASFPDPTHGYVVGASHTIFATADGGQTWAQQDTPLPSAFADGELVEEPSTEATDPTKASFSDVDFVDADHGYAVSTSDAILTTSDGGRTWAEVPTPRPLEVRSDWPKGVPSGWQFNAVSFVDRNVGLVVGEQGVIFRTLDGGATWAYQGDPVYGRLTDVDFLDEVHAEIVGTVIGPDEETYLALGTVDGGETWTFQRSGNPADDDIPINLQAIGFLGEPRRIVAAGGGRIFVSFDGGDTWRSRRSGTLERLEGVAFADRRRGLAVGSVVFPDSARGQILATNDGGQTWYPRPTPEADYPVAVTFADPTTAYVVGCQGGIAPCRQGAILRVDFPELELEVEQPQPSNSRLLPLVLVGGALVVVAGGFLVARRR